MIEIQIFYIFKFHFLVWNCLIFLILILFKRQNLSKPLFAFDALFSNRRDNLHWKPMLGWSFLQSKLWGNSCLQALQSAIPQDLHIFGFFGRRHLWMWMLWYTGLVRFIIIISYHSRMNNNNNNNKNCISGISLFYNSLFVLCIIKTCYRKMFNTCNPGKTDKTTSQNGP